MERDTDMPLGEALVQALTDLRDRLAATGGDLDAAFPLAKPEPKVFDSNYVPKPIFTTLPEPVPTSHTEGSAKTCEQVGETAVVDERNPTPPGDGIDERVYEAARQMFINGPTGSIAEVLRRVTDDAVRKDRELRGAQHAKSGVVVRISQIRECVAGASDGVAVDRLTTLLRAIGVTVEDQA